MKRFGLIGMVFVLGCSSVATRNIDETLEAGGNYSLDIGSASAAGSAAGGAGGVETYTDTETTTETTTTTTTEVNVTEAMALQACLDFVFDDTVIPPVVTDCIVRALGDNIAHVCNVPSSGITYCACFAFGDSESAGHRSLHVNCESATISDRLYI